MQFSEIYLFIYACKICMKTKVIIELVIYWMIHVSRSRRLFTFPKDIFIENDAWCPDISLWLIVDISIFSQINKIMMIWWERWFLLWFQLQSSDPYLHCWPFAWIYFLFSPQKREYEFKSYAKLKLNAKQRTQGFFWSYHLRLKWLLASGKENEIFLHLFLYILRWRGKHFFVYIRFAWEVRRKIVHLQSESEFYISYARIRNFYLVCWWWWYIKEFNVDICWVVFFWIFFVFELTKATSLYIKREPASVLFCLVHRICWSIQIFTIHFFFSHFLYSYFPVICYFFRRRRRIPHKDDNVLCISFFIWFSSSAFELFYLFVFTKRFKVGNFTFWFGCWFESCGASRNTRRYFNSKNGISDWVSVYVQFQ